MNLLLALALSCSVTVERPSVLLVVLDDIGTDMVQAHPNASPEAPPTPTLSLLAAEGVQFTNAWGAPMCSPSRATLLTGRFSHRHGVGGVVQPPATYELPASEVLLAERVSARGYPCAIFGKWHLTFAPDNPCDQGFQVFAGAQGNLPSYFAWDRIDDTSASNASSAPTTEYATSAVTDAALAWIQGQGADPYFCLVAYNAAHHPVHCPPLYMQSECTSSSPARDQFSGMVQSVDFEISRLLAAVDRETTTVIVVGDNGTHEDWAGAQNKAKGTCYRLGIEVPLIIWGAAVDDAGQWGLEDAGHVNVADLYRTILKLLPGSGDEGMQTTALDSVSLLSAQGQFRSNRAWNFTQRFSPLGLSGGPYTLLHRATEDADGFKLIERESGARELYDTALDMDETVDLLADGIDPAEQASLDALYAIQAGLGL